MKWLKVSGVVVGALVVTTLGISASDSLQGASGSLLAQLTGGEDGVCPAGMMEVPTGGTFSCIDIYEASPSKDCDIETVANRADTQTNLNTTDCTSQSTVERLPWTFVTREQAQLICRRGGKRLPTAAEWYHVAIGTPESVTSCNIDGAGVNKTGQHELCVSALGGYDFVGNAWEWVADDVFDGAYNGRALPAEGYVVQVAADGVATVSAPRVARGEGDDYIWTSETGAFGMLRGGYFGSKSDAGVYAVQARTVPTAATEAIGFRCVR